MSKRTPEQTFSRRGLLKTGVGATAAVAATSGTALAQDAPYGGYLDGVNNYNGKTADFTGQDSVTVKVGAGNGLLFGPAAINVDTGTTVTWEWTGQGGSHNVVAEDGTFDSGSTMSSGTYDYTFEEAGVYQYYCNPHKGAGMRGVVAVGDTVEGDLVDPSELDSGSDSGDDGGSDGGSATYDFGGYLDGANLYEGPDSVEDLRGESSVTVEVGAGSGFAFSPPAIHIDPGTAVTWEWTGQGGGHNVIANDGTFDSGQTQTSGTFEYTFEEDGTHTYYCNPHEGAGMKGAVVVGSGGSGGGGAANNQPETAANDLALGTLAAMLILGLLSPIVFLLFVRRKMGGPPRPD
jgi:halocyanin-like protein